MSAERGRVSLEDLRRIEAELDREAERLRLVGEMAWQRLWIYFCHAHRDLWSIPARDPLWWSPRGGWESHGDHVAFERALARLHIMRCRLWAVTAPGERGPRPLGGVWEQIRCYGGLGDPG